MTTYSPAALAADSALPVFGYDPDYSPVLPEPGITCGNRARHGGEVGQHYTVNDVRLCYGHGCTWLVSVGRDEDGQEIIRDCGARVTVTDRGWHCTNGHDHVTAEVRFNERWDYCSDAQEAAQLRKYGVDAVAMDGGSI